MLILKFMINIKFIIPGNDYNSPLEYYKRLICFTVDSVGFHPPDGKSAECQVGTLAWGNFFGSINKHIYFLKVNLC